MDNNNVALITKMVLEAVEKQKSSEKEPGYLVPVGVSARHIHLTQEHVEALFGPGYQLTKKKELMGGQFASNETVTIYLNEGCIIAKRHIHMPPKDAMAAGVHDGDVVSVQAENERGTVFNHVQIRVDDSFTLEMHIDTDEANAAKIATGQTVRIIK